MATKRRRGERWEYRITRSGLLEKPVWLSFTSEAEGDDYVRRLELLLDRGIVPDEFKRQAPGGLREAAQRYLSAQHVSATDRACLRIVLDRLPASTMLRELTFPWVSKWVTSMKREDKLSPTTIRHHVGALARCLDWLAAHADIPLNPLRLLPRGYSTYTPADAAVAGVERRDEERDRRLQEGEEAAILAVLDGAKRDDRQRALALPERAALRLLFVLALETAMRLRELFTLDWSQVDLGKRTVFLERTKNGSRRQVPLSSVAMAALGKAKTGPVFPWPTDNLPRTTSLLSRQFARIFDAAGCPDLHTHDLRHEATSRLFERTSLSDVEIAKIVGHSSTRMLMRYANLRGSALAERLW